MLAVEFITLLHRKPPSCIEYAIVVTLIWLKKGVGRKGKYTIAMAIYRVSIKSLPDYKHLLQENYVEYKHIFFAIT